MAREKYPFCIVRFEAFVLEDERYVERGWPTEYAAFSGVIEPTSEPCTQAQYDKQVRRQLTAYKREKNVIRIECVYFFQNPVGALSGPIIYFQRGQK